MSLDLKPLHLYNVIMKCLSIESVEYCYFIPILAQTAEYWGDVKLTSICNIMSRQVKQHLNQAIHIHLLLSGQLKNNSYLDKTNPIFSKKINSEKKKQQLQYFSQFYTSVPFSIPMENDFSYQNETSMPFQTHDSEKNHIFTSLGHRDQNSCHVLEIKGIPESVDFNYSTQFFSKRKIVDKETCLLFLKFLRSRKIWKAEEWYPLVSTLLLNNRVFHQSSSFIKLSQSEKNMSQLLTVLIEEK